MDTQSADFVAAMRQFSAAVSIVTTGRKGERHGLTATAVFSLTAQPPRIGVAVNRSASAHPKIIQNERFCINTLTAGQEAIAKGFAGGLKPAERFETGNWTTSETGVPILEDALISLECGVEQAIDFDTHTLFIGRVSSVRIGTTSRPLLFVNGQWASLVPGTKADLDHMLVRLQRSTGAVDQATSSCEDVGSALECFMQSYTEQTIAEQADTRNFFSSELYATPETMANLNQANRRFQERVAKLVQQGIDDGSFDVEDAGLTSRVLTGIVHWTHRWYRPDGRLTASEVGAHLAKLARRMVGAR